MGTKYKKIFILAVIIFIASLLCASTPIYGYKAILPSTNLYLSSDINSEVVATIPQNASVTPIDKSFQVGEFNWQKVSYNTIEGYVLSHDLYESREAESYKIKKGKARSAEIGADINLYVSNDKGSGILGVIHDGEHINIVSTKVDYGEFVLIEYQGNTYFALNSNITTSLSLNQTLALIIGGSAALLAVVIIIIFITVKNKKVYKKTD
jgi:uncharacterized protein YgiM (DUF1202 family)